MPLHLLDDDAKPIGVPQLIQRYNGEHPDRLPVAALLIAQQAPAAVRTDTTEMPAAPAAPPRLVTA